MYSDFLNNLKHQDNFTLTENGAIAYRSTGNAVLDAFSRLGAMKAAEDRDILDIYYRALAEDKTLATKLLFYMRDIRGGQGMRRVFRTIIRSLAQTHPMIVSANLDNICHYGRGDDLLALLGTPVEKELISYIKKTIENDTLSVISGGECSLLAKWLPSENTSSEDTKALAKYLREKMGLTSRQYRKRLSYLRKAINIVESQMSQDKWDTIDYEKLPSKASLKYPAAFMRHSEDRYVDYLKKLSDGTAKVNANALFPVDIVSKVMHNPVTNFTKATLYDAMWKALPNYFGDTEETGLCVVDTSGSMEGEPMEVALSLGIYCADKAKGPFHNHFITFSESPQLQEIKGETITDKVRFLHDAGWGWNTNIEKVFDLILDTAIRNHSPQSDLPTKLYIISDMQFDYAAPNVRSSAVMTLMESLSDKFARNGYTMPALIYWNVRDSKCGMYQMDKDSKNCCFVSGYSPSLFKAVIEGTDYVEEVAEDGTVKVTQKIDPIEVMLRTLNNERYNRVVV